jgi:hypothetical protein
VPHNQGIISHEKEPNTQSTNQSAKHLFLLLLVLSYLWEKDFPQRRRVFPAIED